MMDIHDVKSVTVILVSNGASFMAVMGIYTKLIQKQAKIEFLIRRVCEKLDISTETTL